MSAAVENQIPEAELAVAEDFNPYQAPAASPHALAISDGIGRATLEEINGVRISSMCAEITFVTAGVAQLAAMMTGFEHELTAALCFGCGLAAWICFAWMVLCSNDTDLVSVAAIFMFPIPIFGSLLYFAFRRRAVRFLIWNGYLPGFLGAVPDAEEIRLMNNNSLYRPAIVVNFDGSKRQLTWSLSDWFIMSAVGAGIFVIVFASMGIGIF